MKTTEKKDLKNKIKEFAHTKGADFTGIASCKSLDGAPVGHKPENLLPSVRSVISCAKRIPNSVVNEGPPTSYHNMMRILEVQLGFVSYATSVFIEYFEWLAIPIASNRSNYDWDPETQHGRGDISHKHVAEAAGVGRMGKNSLLITPEFGNRVQLVSIVTNLDLEPDPIINNDLCPPDRSEERRVGKECRSRWSPDH